MAIGKRIRFEVFKRDVFTCQYCGIASPKVVLEVDHVIPVCEGGADNLENLITSCFDCNRGKGKYLLDEYRTGNDPTEQAIFLLEKERQLKEYNEVLKNVRERKLSEVNEILKYWNKSFIMNGCWFPEGNIMSALEYIPKEKILEAVDICRGSRIRRADTSYGEGIKLYFLGILRNMTNNYGRGLDG